MNSSTEMNDIPQAFGSAASPNPPALPISTNPHRSPLFSNDEQIQKILSLNKSAPHQNLIEPTLAPHITAKQISGQSEQAVSICGYVTTSLLILFPVGVHYGCYLRQNCTQSFYNYSAAGLAGAIISSLLVTIGIVFIFWSYYRVAKSNPGTIPIYLRSTFFDESVKRAIVLYCRQKEFTILSDLHIKAEEERRTSVDDSSSTASLSPFPQPLEIFKCNPSAPCFILSDLSLKSESRINWEDPYSEVYRKVINPQFYDLQKRQLEIQSFAPSPTAPRPITATQLLQSAFVPRESREPSHYYSHDIKNMNMANVVGTQACIKCSDVYHENPNLYAFVDNSYCNSGRKRSGYLQNSQKQDAGRDLLVQKRGTKREEEDPRQPPESYQYDPNPATNVMQPPKRDNKQPLAGTVVKWGEVHHCSTCQQCILSMDHHCPWVGQCIGRTNHKFFIQFLFFVSITALISLLSMSKDIFTGDGNIGIALGISSKANEKSNACTWLMMVTFVIEGLFFLLLFPFFWSSMENAMTGDTKLEMMIRRRNEATQRVNDALRSAGVADREQPTNSQVNIQPGHHHAVDTEAEFQRLMRTHYPNSLISPKMPTSGGIVQIDGDSDDESSDFSANDKDDVVGSWRYNLSTIFGPARLQRFGIFSWFLPTNPVPDYRRDYILWRDGLCSNVQARLVTKK